MAAPDEITIGEYLISRLYDNGIRHIFGIPGDYVLTFYKQLEQSDIKIINTCDEQGAGFAADAYARIKGFGAVCITYAVGGLKVANTTAQAFAEESPVIIISGAPGVKERSGDPMLHHKVKTFDTQLKVFEQLTVASAVLDNPDTACSDIDRVLGAAGCFRRPVYIELPRDMVLTKVTPAPASVTCPVSDPQKLKEALLEAEAIINRAEKPVIVAGTELMRYGLEKEMLQFAEATKIPIASSMLSKAVIDEVHPLYLGIYQGGMSHEVVRDYVETSDCLIFLGMFMTDINLGIFTAHLDQEVSIFSASDRTMIRHNTYSSVSMSDFLSGLLKSNITAKEAPAILHPARKREFKAKKNTPITIERVLELLESSLDGNSFVIADTGDALFATSDITIPKAAEYMSSAYYASMGFAVPAGIAVQLAHPDLRPIVIVGDGAFQMTGMELATAVRYKLSPVVLVLNNYGYGTERPMLDGTFNDVSTWLYSRIPEVLDAGRGFDIQTEEDLANAWKESLAYRDGFCILDIHLDPKGISPALKRLAAALGKRVKG